MFYVMSVPVNATIIGDRLAYGANRKRHNNTDIQRLTHKNKNTINKLNSFLFLIKMSGTCIQRVSSK